MRALRRLRIPAAVREQDRPRRSRCGPRAPGHRGTPRGSGRPDVGAGPAGHARRLRQAPRRRLGAPRASRRTTRRSWSHSSTTSRTSRRAACSWSSRPRHGVSSCIRCSSARAYGRRRRRGDDRNRGAAPILEGDADAAPSASSSRSSERPTGRRSLRKCSRERFDARSGELRLGTRGQVTAIAVFDKGQPCSISRSPRAGREAVGPSRPRSATASANRAPRPRARSSRRLTWNRSS
jgi:hypothetical protein